MWFVLLGYVFLDLLASWWRYYLLNISRTAYFFIFLYVHLWAWGLDGHHCSSNELTKFSLLFHSDFHSLSTTFFFPGP